MEKLKFVFKAKATQDGKSNFIAITSIITPEEKIFLVPEDLQPAHIHEEIFKSKEYATIKNSIKKRHQTRSVWIKMTDTIRKTYCDDVDNMIFADQYLEESTKEQLNATI